MATATLITPSAHYQPQPSFPSAYPHSSAASISNMISSVEPRKSVDDSEPSNRQSLPSISEVIQGAKPGSYPPAPPSMQPGSSLPSPFSSGPRSFSDADKHSPPQPLHPTSFPPRQDALPSFSDSPRPPFNSRPSLPPVSDRRPSPTSKPDMAPQHHHPEQQKPESHHPLNGGYAHPPPPPGSYQPGQMPPGQMPLPAYPISPRHGVPPHLSGAYDPRGPPHPEEAEYSARARYDTTVNRHFESWSYQDSLSRVSININYSQKTFLTMIRLDLHLGRFSTLRKLIVELPKSSTEHTRFLSDCQQNVRSATCSATLSLSSDLWSK